MLPPLIEHFAHDHVQALCPYLIIMSRPERKDIMSKCEKFFLFPSKRSPRVLTSVLRAAKSGALAWQTRRVFSSSPPPLSSVFRHSHVQTYHPSPLPFSPLFAPRPHVKDDDGGKQGTQQRAGNPVLWRRGHATQRQIGWGSVLLAEPDEFTISLLPRD